jgi:signal transduction histidine kinase
VRAAPAIATVVCLVLLLTLFSLRAANPEAELFDRALTELDRFAMSENALHRDVFAARAGVLRNYDPLESEINALRASLQRLKDSTTNDTETIAAVDRLAGSIDRQEALVESFKSENALLQNSLSFFGRFGGEAGAPDLDPAVSAASAAILRLTLDTSSAAVRDVQDRLDRLEQEASRTGEHYSIEALLAHGRLLQTLLPSADNVLKELRAVPQKQQRDALRALIMDRQLASRTSASRYRALLYGTSLALVAFLVHLGLQSRSRANALRRRAALEHVIAGISMRFINAAPQDIDAEIDRALADMAAHFDSDRAYFLMSAPRERLHLWHKPGLELPPGWPRRAPELAARIGAGSDRTVHIPRVHRMPIGENRTSCLSFGLEGWACVTNADNDGVSAALGFDAVGRRSQISAAGELALLRMALDTFVHAAERHTIEKERTRLETSLRQAQRLEKIGIMTSGIAHNFNNILGGILGHSEVIEENADPDAKLVRNLAAIRRGAERARDLVDQILVFGRRRNAARQPLSVAALVAEAASLLSVSLPAGIDLVVRQSPTATIVSGEQAQLQQVLLNLCNNAANAMPAGGRIEVTTELHEIALSRTLSHDRIEPGRYVCIAVSDTGHGMDETTLARIFEPFFTTRSSGNGLGLATVRVIVREHGGAVSAQSRPGEGSRFEVWLPWAAAEQAAGPGVAALPTGHGETIILLARDCGDVLRAEDILAALGYEPVGFTRIKAAVAACRAEPNRFDAVIIGDLDPAEQTREMVATLHAAAPRLPVILATKAAIEIGADTLVSTGISDVVRWPMVAEEIAVSLANSLSMKRPASPRKAGNVIAG